MNIDFCVDSSISSLWEIVLVSWMVNCGIMANVFWWSGCFSWKTEIVSPLSSSTLLSNTSFNTAEKAKQKPKFKTLCFLFFFSFFCYWLTHKMALKRKVTKVKITGEFLNLFFIRIKPISWNDHPNFNMLIAPNCCLRVHGSFPTNCCRAENFTQSSSWLFSNVIWLIFFLCSFIVGNFFFLFLRCRRHDHCHD
jgi:hypothetical protein